MQPTYKYFDSNRAANPINVIAVVSDGDTGVGGPYPSCSGAGYEMLNIYNFEGTNAGYKTTSNQWYQGTAPSGATSIGVHSPV